jgi:predicted Fe-Mo cluster-binding NifX family protein
MTDRTASRIRLAVPSETTGGLDAARSGHFGRSPSFTLIDLIDGEIAGVDFVENAPHRHGGCMSPVLTLGTNMVDAVIVAGIGHRPLLG